jgi:hypothetical protein
MPNKSKDRKVLTKTQDNLIIGSESLFKGSLTDSFSKSFSKEHDIALIAKDEDLSLDDRVMNLYTSLIKMDELEYDKKIFIGYQDDCFLLFELFTKYDYSFDAAVLINCEIHSRSGHPKYSLAKLSTRTKVYNLFSKLTKYTALPFAHVNQEIPKYLSPLVSSVYAQEACGLITYDFHQKMFLSDNYGQMVLI